MILAAHQPAYLPWLGYLDKLARCDVFIVVDDAQYEAQNFQNRNRVKINNGVTWLTVPLLDGSRGDRICDKRIARPLQSKEDWQRRTFRTLEVHYGRAPHFRDYAPELKDVYTRRWETLVDLDLHLLQLFMRWLGINKPVLRSSTLGITAHKTGRIVELCRRTGATHYLSGSGGSRGYLDLLQLKAASVDVIWQSFQHPVYPQRYPHLGFVPNLGVIDLLFNCGPRSRDILLGVPDRLEVRCEAAV